MSSLYVVSVVAKTPRTVDLNVRVDHPDAMFIPSSPGFALQLLQESTTSNSALSGEIDFDTVQSASWIKQHAFGFVNKVDQLSLINLPPQAAEEDDDHPYWSNQSGWPQAVLRVEVTHEDWISHLTTGQSWAGASFDDYDDDFYEPCAPILPGAAEAKAAPSSEPATNLEGFLPVPAFFNLRGFSGLSSPVLVPKYSQSAYVANEVHDRESLPAALVNTMIGKTVLYSSGDEMAMGVLVSRNQVGVMSDGVTGRSGIPLGKGSIGVATFNPSKNRLPPPLTYAYFLRSVEPVVEEITVNGTTATLDLVVAAPGKKLSLSSATAALELLAVSEAQDNNTSFNDSFKDATSPLGRQIHNLLTETKIPMPWDLFTKIAGGVVSSYTVEQTAEALDIDFDTLGPSDVIAVFEQRPWARWRVTISVTDPAWIEHLPSACPYNYAFGYSPEAEPWTGAPLRWRNAR